MYLRTALIALAVAAILMGNAASAGASVSVRPLAGPEAREALVAWSLNHGMVKAEPKRCKRLDPSTLRCQLVETGQWNATLWAEEVWSVYKVWRLRSGDVHVRWLDFVYEEAE